MANEDTIKNLSALLQALDSMRPRDKMDEYVQKTLLDFQLQKHLVNMQREESADADIQNLLLAQQYTGGASQGKDTEDDLALESVMQGLDERGGAKGFKETAKSAVKIGLSKVLPITMGGDPSGQNVGKVIKEDSNARFVQDHVTALDLLEQQIYKGGAYNVLDSEGEETDDIAYDVNTALISQLPNAAASKFIRDDLRKDVNLYKGYLNDLTTKSELYGDSEGPKRNLYKENPDLWKRVNVLADYIYETERILDKIDFQQSR